MRIFNLLCFMLLGVMASAQTAAIKGTVSGAQNEEVPYAVVSLEEPGKTTTTDVNGKFNILDLTPGSYTLTVSSPGYTTAVEKINLSAGEIRILNIQLEEELKTLAEVMITTNRRVETLDEVPSSVSVLGQREIQRLNLTSNSIADVMNEVPGLALSTSQTSSTGQTLRGRNMLVLIDGIPQSTPLRNGSRDVNTIDPNVIERIEIIKGATAIYGNGADGGIINYITKKPKATGKLESTTELSSGLSLVNPEHTLSSKLSQTFSGQTGKLGYVANGSFGQTGIFRDANAEVISPSYGLGETNQYNFFGKLNYKLAFDHDLELMYNYFSSNQDSEYTNLPGVYGERPAIGVIGEEPGVDQGNRYNHNGQLTYNVYRLFGETDFNANLYFQDFKTVYAFSPFFFNAETGYDGGQSMIESDKMGLRANFRTPYALGSEISGDILYGIDILNDVTSQHLVDGRLWVPEVDMKNFAPYAQFKALYQDFVLKAGIRFENINIDIPDYTTIYIVPNGGTPQGNVPVEGGELKYDATTFNAGLRYNRWELFKPFVSFSQSFSIADLGRTLRSATENTVGQIASEAVIANNYEVGFNSYFGNTSLSGAYFISTSELGATYLEVNGIFQIARQPEKVYGYELALDTKLLENLTFGTSVSYIEGKLDSGDDGSYDRYMNGDRIPPVKIASYLNYGLSNKLNLRLSHIYSGERKKFDPRANGTYVYGQGPVDAFNLVNLTANYQLSTNTGLSLGVQNLLNEDYYLPISQWDARPDNYIKGNGARMNLALKVQL
ncbi:iron complex outermembrane recepter protein [Salinimicrobium sediminis]|uniref:Iron complex outermembrane recepter protein n=1 Tax=Salinimicrobium sediminis TaxID=1343891 RepID=A0A285X060_9FLAO|nr:TonB-dependent receptor [Salinimicrobium sediminis]SOC78723.1 iron complex outermembrane recepter protein [Salinimicrobium sediminis]